MYEIFKILEETTSYCIEFDILCPFLNLKFFIEGANDFNGIIIRNFSGLHVMFIVKSKKGSTQSDCTTHELVFPKKVS